MSKLNVVVLYDRWDEPEVESASAEKAPLTRTLDKKEVEDEVAETLGKLGHDATLHVLDGSVTFVTGGSVVDPKVVGQDEVRGSRIEGGTLHALNKGDVIVVPAGTPHWFSQVDETFLYYVVKATAADAIGGTK